MADYGDRDKDPGAPGSRAEPRATPAAAPGKSTLIEQVYGRAGAPVQRRETDGATAPGPDAIHALAAHGVGGSGGAVPHAEPILASAGEAFRPVIEGIDAHVGGAAAEASTAMGADGYAVGSSVAFASPPDLALAAHEVAHVAQQARGVHLSSGTGARGDVYERDADAFAARVVRGLPAGDLLGGAPSSSSVAPAGAAVQRRDSDVAGPDPGGGGAGKRLDLTVHEPTDLPERVVAFRRALGSGDRDAAERAWMLTTAEDRRAFGRSPSVDRDLVSIVRVLGPMTIHVMGQSGLDFRGREDLIELILQRGMPHWFDGMDQYGGALVDSFVAHLPARDRLDDAAVAKLQRLIQGSNSLALARPVFERLYAPLSDTTYDAGELRTAAWEAPVIHRLYDVLASHLPRAHVRAVSAFYLGTEQKEGGVWQTLDYGWWTEDNQVVMPKKSAGDGGTRNHRMTGGGRAQLDPGSGKGKTEGAMNHFDVTALHEVGHAVGGRLGGHAWAEGYGGVGWQTHLDADAWSRHLWGDDAALSARAQHKAGDDRVLPAADARRYLADDVRGAGKPPAGWTSDEVDDAVAQQYGDQPLTRYWQAVKDAGDRSDSYRFPGTNNYGSDGNVYVWLSRNDSHFSAYKQHAHAHKVSWYSLASPHEWWAEQYAHYYRLGKTGAGLDPDTKAELDKLDTQTPPEDAAPAPAAPGGASEGAGAAPARRLPFPW